MDNDKNPPSAVWSCDFDCSETATLCIFYAVASLMVIFLAISLLWFPFLQLVSEINTIIARVVIYVNNEFVGVKNSALIDSLEASVNSPKLIIAISLMCLSYILFQASGEFLMAAACYISSLPDSTYFNCIKQFILEGIVKLLTMKAENPEEKKPPPRRIEL